MSSDTDRPAIQFFYGEQVVHCHVVVPLAITNGVFNQEEEVTSYEFEDKLRSLIEQMGYMPQVLAACSRRQRTTGKPTSISYHLLIG